MVQTRDPRPCVLKPELEGVVEIVKGVRIVLVCGEVCLVEFWKSYTRVRDEGLK